VRRLLLSLQEAHAVPQGDGHWRHERSEQSHTGPWRRCTDASSNSQRTVVQTQQKMSRMHY